MKSTSGVGTAAFHAAAQPRSQTRRARVAVSLCLFWASSSVLVAACAASNESAPETDADAALTPTGQEDSSTTDLVSPEDDARVEPGDARPAPNDARAPIFDASRDAALTPEQTIVCNADATRNLCSDSGRPPQPCESALKCVVKYMEPVAITAFASCFSYPSCKREEACYDAAGLAAGGDTARDFVSKCLAKGAECGAAADIMKYCTPALYAFRGIGAALTGCLAKTCAEQQGCFDPIVRPVARCD